MQGKRTRALDSRGRPVKGLYVRDGKFVAGIQEAGRWTMRTLDAATLTEARREREALIADLAAGRAAPRSGVTFADAFADWQRSRALSERTIRDERAVARRYLSTILARRVQDVAAADAAAVLHANRHLAEWTRVHIYRILAGTFAHALRRGVISRNPVDGLSKAERPRQRNKRNVARLVSADLERLVSAASTARDRAAIGLAGYAGLRIGELRALHWGEVDFDAGTVTVLRACTEDGAFKQPKSEAGIRTVPMLPALRDLLVPLARFEGVVIATRRWQGGPGAEPAPLARRGQAQGGYGRRRGAAFLAQPPPQLRLLLGDGARAAADDGGADHGPRGRRVHAARLRARRPLRRRPGRRGARQGQ
jgi:integrase